MQWLLGGPLGPDGELVFSSPDWAIGAAVFIGLVSVVLAAWSGLKVRPVRWELLLLIPGVAAVVFAAMGPMWVEENGRVEPPRFVVLVDDSRSMGIKEDGAPRSDQVQAAMDALSGEELEIYTFGRELGVGGPGTFDQAHSDLGQALQAIHERYIGEDLAGIAVITDGLDRGGLRRQFELGDTRLPELPGPLSVYQVGEAREVRDLAIDELATGGFAFIHADFQVKATVRSTGFEGRPVPVTLKLDGRVVQTRTVQVGEDGTGLATFDLKLKKPGRYIYEAEVPVWDGDAVEGNNTMAVAVRVVRDRLRVLQVCGSPSFDQKFLRLFLKQDPSIDLVSFFILRTNDDLNAGYHESELSLIQFPYESLFEEDLESFDLVIFQNFDYASFFRFEGQRLLGNIADYVQGGKAFVMIGGDRSFDLGQYAGTPLADVLPVQLGVDGDAVDTAKFRPQLSKAGKVHPVTRLLGNGVDNEALWGRLPELDGLNLSYGLARGSAMLLGHPTLTTSQGKPLPVVAVREAGRGRTMALMGDSSWRWVMTEAAEGGGNQAYLRFWKNAIRWLVKDREGQRVRVTTTQENYVVGETVRIVASVRDVGFEAVEDVVVRGTVSLDGEAMAFDGTTDAEGEAVFEVEASQRGAWRIDLTAGEPGRVLGGDRTAFAVTNRDPELEDVVPATAFLKALATAGGGRFHTAGGFGAPTVDDTAGRFVPDRVETPLWSAPIWSLLAAVFLSLSWWVRRRRGLR